MLPFLQEDVSHVVDLFLYQYLAEKPHTGWRQTLPNE